MKYILIILIICLLSYVFYQRIRINRLINVGKNLVLQTQAYSHKPDRPHSRFLFMGDSLGVGVGATLPEHSIAGKLAADYPNTEIINLSVSGAKIRDALKVIDALNKEDTFDMIFIQIGGNDIVHLTNFKNASQDLEMLLTKAQTHSDKVLFYSAGSIGSAPLFPFPVNEFYHLRSKKFFTEFKRVAANTNTTYIDLYYPRSEDPFLKNPKEYYAEDLFHVSDAAYELWYQKILKSI